MDKKEELENDALDKKKDEFMKYLRIFPNQLMNALAEKLDPKEEKLTFIEEELRLFLK